MPFLFSILFLIAFLLVFCSIAAALIQSLRQWNRNNHAPRLTVDALVTSKRTRVSHHNHHTANGHHHHTTSTSYYVTFQVDSGDRMELSVGGGDYGLLAEGDRGRLSFQGTRYLGFDRIP